ncbi:MAG: DUF2975 domain-containing protein [Streptococcaceae bacterium]|jgi:hypothetical protein|nr:DUF2975 domain-containing protein [Streptococcaceae bacterium]
MKNKSTLLLKLAIIALSIPVVIGLGLITYSLIDNPVQIAVAKMIYPIVIGLFASSIPYFMGLFQAFKLLQLIEQHEAFSEKAVIKLKKIRNYAFVVCGIYLILPYPLYQLAQLEDAPGLIIIGMTPFFVSFLIAIFASLLVKLLQEAVFMKEENRLMV